MKCSLLLEDITVWSSDSQNRENEIIYFFKVLYNCKGHHQIGWGYFKESFHWFWIIWQYFFCSIRQCPGLLFPTFNESITTNQPLKLISIHLLLSLIWFKRGIITLIITLTYNQQTCKVNTSQLQVQYGGAKQINKTKQKQPRSSFQISSRATDQLWEIRMAGKTKQTGLWSQETKQKMRMKWKKKA